VGVLKVAGQNLFGDANENVGPGRDFLLAPVKLLVRANLLAPADWAGAFPGASNRAGQDYFAGAVKVIGPGLTILWTPITWLVRINLLTAVN
jgi:hypothetical protein